MADVATTIAVEVAKQWGRALASLVLLEEGTYGLTADDAQSAGWKPRLGMLEQSTAAWQAYVNELLTELHFSVLPIMLQIAHTSWAE